MHIFWALNDLNFEFWGYLPLIASMAQINPNLGCWNFENLKRNWISGISHKYFLIPTYAIVFLIASFWQNLNFKIQILADRNYFLTIRAQSRKQNRKAWYRCPLSLGGKFGKRNRGHCYRFLWVRCLKSSVLLPNFYPKRENSNPKLFLYEIAFGQWNQRLWAKNPKESLTKTSVIFPKFSFQKRWAKILCLAVLFTWLRP